VKDNITVSKSKHQALKRLRMAVLNYLDAIQQGGEGDCGMEDFWKDVEALAGEETTGYPGKPVYPVFYWLWEMKQAEEKI
jgi:hypothetical protein